MRRWLLALSLVALAPGCRCDATDGPAPAPSSSAAPRPAGRWVGLALGDEHACALRRDGHLHCWGRVPAGAGFDGVAVLRPRPATLPPAQRVTAGSGVTCTLGQGTVRCWGELTEGLRWDAPTPIEGLAGATDIVLGRDHLCGLIDERVRCLGSNAHGQLGDGTTSAREGVVDVKGLDDVIALTAGDNFTCGRRNELTVFCWGQGDLGQLGQGRLVSSSVPVGVEGLTEVTFVKAGGATACAGRSDGTVVCWGAEAGDLIDDRRIEESRQILQNGVRNLADVAIAGGAACGRRDDGTLLCWGDGRDALLGDASRLERWQGPAPISGVTAATALAASPTAMCALVDGGERAACWGSADHGLLGNGTRRRHGMVKVGVTDARSIAVGEGWSCALRVEGELRCWGRGSLPPVAGRASAPWTVGRADGILSLGPTMAVVGPTPTFVTPRGMQTTWSTPKTWRSFSGDGTRFVGVDEEGQPFAFIGPARGEPTPIEGLPPLEEVVVAGLRSCARTRTGEVLCYPPPEGGVAEPRAVPGVTAATDLAFAGSSGLVVVGGDARAFRYRAGDETPRERASSVAGPDVVAVAVGGPLGGTDCVVHGDGRLACEGALAPPNSVDDAAEVALSTSHGCVRHRAGNVSCWGDDAYDQVGSPVPAFALSPVTVALP